MSKEKKITFPSAWVDLNEEDFIDIAHLVNSDKDDFEALTKISHILSGLSDMEFINSEPESLTKLCKERCQWLTVIEFSKSMLPSISSGRKTYTGPADDLANFTYTRFATAEMFFQAYANTQDAQYLDKLLSVLYTAKPFDRDKIKQNLNAMAWLPTKLKSAAYVNWVGLRMDFSKQYPAVFEGAEQANTKNSALNHWDALADDLAGPQFGTVTQVHDTNLHLIFTHLQNNAEKKG